MSKMPRRINWTGEQVIRVFKMRGEGANFKAIAKVMGCSDNYIRHVIHFKGLPNDFYPNVTVPTEIMARAVKNVRSAKPERRVLKGRVKSKANGACASTIIGEFAAMCKEMADVERRALKYFSKEALDMVKLSITEGA